MARLIQTHRPDGTPAFVCLCSCAQSPWQSDCLGAAYIAESAQLSTSVQAVKLHRDGLGAPLVHVHDTTGLAASAGQQACWGYSRTLAVSFCRWVLLRISA